MSSTSVFKRIAEKLARKEPLTSTERAVHMRADMKGAEESVIKTLKEFGIDPESLGLSGDGRLMRAIMGEVDDQPVAPKASAIVSGRDARAALDRGMARKKVDKPAEKTQDLLEKSSANNASVVDLKKMPPPPAPLKTKEEVANQLVESSTPETIVKQRLSGTEAEAPVVPPKELSKFQKLIMGQPTEEVKIIKPESSSFKPKELSDKEILQKRLYGETEENQSFAKTKEEVMQYIKSLDLTNQEAKEFADNLVKNSKGLYLLPEASPKSLVPVGSREIVPVSKKIPKEAPIAEAIPEEVSLAPIPKEVPVSPKELMTVEPSRTSPLDSNTDSVSELPSLASPSVAVAAGAAGAVASGKEDKKARDLADETGVPYDIVVQWLATQETK